MGTARSFLVMAGMLFGLCLGSAPSSAERDSNNYWRPESSSEDLFDYTRSRRRYDWLDYDYFNRIDRRKAGRNGVPAIIEEKPEPPLVYQPEKLEMLRAANLTDVEPAGEVMVIGAPERSTTRVASARLCTSTTGPATVRRPGRGHPSTATAGSAPGTGSQHSRCPSRAVRRSRRPPQRC